MDTENIFSSHYYCSRKNHLWPSLHTEDLWKTPIALFWFNRLNKFLSLVFITFSCCHSATTVRCINSCHFLYLNLSNCRPVSNYSLSLIKTWTKQFRLVIHQEFKIFLQKNITWQVASQMQQLLTALRNRNKTENWQRSFFWWVIFNQVKSLTQFSARLHKPWHTRIKNWRQDKKHTTKTHNPSIALDSVFRH